MPLWELRVQGLGFYQPAWLQGAQPDVPLLPRPAASHSFSASDQPLLQPQPPQAAYVQPAASCVGLHMPLAPAQRAHPIQDTPWPPQLQHIPSLREPLPLSSAELAQAAQGLHGPWLGSQAASLHLAELERSVELQRQQALFSRPQEGLSWQPGGGSRAQLGSQAQLPAPPMPSALTLDNVPHVSLCCCCKAVLVLVLHCCV